MIHKPKCEDNDITTNRTSDESHLQWEDQFLKNPLNFRKMADFEADNELDNTYIGNKTTKIYKQNPVLNGYCIVSEVDDVLQSGYYESPLRFENMDRFLVENMKSDNERAFYFKNTKKDIFKTQEDKENFYNCNFCHFCEKTFESDKVRDHCRLTGKKD